MVGSHIPRVAEDEGVRVREREEDLGGFAECGWRYCMPGRVLLDGSTEVVDVPSRGE